MSVRIPYYPPLAVAAGGPFFVWLFGSLTWDELGESGDLLMGLLFGLLFLALATFTIGAWIDIFLAKRIGLVLDDQGVREITAGFVRLHIRARPWSEIRSVTQEKGALLFNGEREPLRVSTSGLLETPQWIIDRAGRFLEPAGDDEWLEKLDLELEPLSCTSCGGSVEAPLGPATDVTCTDCGSTNTLPEAMRRAVAQVREIVRDIPEVHRRLERKALLRLLSRGLSFRQGMVRWSWVTGGGFFLVALVGLISDPSDARFPIVMLGIGGSALLFGYGVALATRTLAAGYATASSAAPPLQVGGPVRCRLCGGSLPGRDLVRRCEYCDSDSLVTGAILGQAVRSARQGLLQARRLTEQSTDASSAVMDRVAFNLEMLALLQLVWLQVPIVIALDGMHGMLRLTATCLAIALANLGAGFLALGWLRRSHA